jgi:hypothetical protein
MRIWLDDKRVMPEGFDVWCKTAKHASELVSSGKVTHLSFDHDLGSSKLTGYSVALVVELLAYDKKIKPFTWEIHSANPVGKKAIKQAMESAERFWESD